MMWFGLEEKRSDRAQREERAGDGGGVTGSTDRKTCFWPNLKLGNWRAAVFASSAMVVVVPVEDIAMNRSGT